MFLVGLQVGCQENARSIQTASERPVEADGHSAGDGQTASPNLVAKLYVKGMSCPLCAHNIDRQLLKVPGVKKVTVDLGTGEVQATLAADNPPNRDQLARAVKQSGFTLDRIEMPIP
jgi:copper chaperone CopZ